MSAEGPAVDGRILVIDDQEANLRLLQRILSRAGHRDVHVTTDARQVEGLVASLEPDLLLLDLHMPHLDGHAVLERLAGPRDAEGFLPVLVLTADADPATRRRALELGATDYLTKPFDADEVVLRCRNLLRTRQLYRQVSKQNEVLADELVARAGELRDARSAHDLVLGALNQLNHASTLEERAGALVEELARTAQFDAVSIMAIDPDGGVTPLAIGGMSAFNEIVGRPLSPDEAASLRARWNDSPWTEEIDPDAYGERVGRLVRESGLRLSCYVPITEQGRPVGLLAASSRCDAEAEVSRDGRLALAREFGAIARAVLGSGLAERHERAVARQHLQTVLADGGYRPVFQPVVDLRRRDIIGYEALTRFADGVRPDLRFADARRVGLGLQLEEATLIAALAAADELPHSAWLSINASPDLLLDAGRLARVLAGARRMVVIEITEHVAIDDYDALRRALRSIGSNVRVAIDDAGAGFASFRHVLELEPDFVKLDADLVRGVENDTSRQALVVGMRYFAQQTGSTLIAEGVETEAERAMLGELGIRFGQGYLFARPMPVSELASAAAT